jgi:hypothetical protein
MTEHAQDNYDIWAMEERAQESLTTDTCECCGEPLGFDFCHISEEGIDTCEECAKDYYKANESEENFDLYLGSKRCA